MARRTAISIFRAHARLVLVIMLAVVASMTIHHGAMASVIDTPQLQHAHHENHGTCAGDCEPRTHSMPVCCAMGLCLSALVGNDYSEPFAVRHDDVGGLVASVMPRQTSERIDRPPKPSVRA